jgi:hypothetical protein
MIRRWCCLYIIFFSQGLCFVEWVVLWWVVLQLQEIELYRQKKFFFLFKVVYTHKSYCYFHDINIFSLLRKHGTIFPLLGLTIQGWADGPVSPLLERVVQNCSLQTLSSNLSTHIILLVLRVEIDRTRDWTNNWINWSFHWWLSTYIQGKRRLQTGQWFGRRSWICRFLHRGGFPRVVTSRDLSN